MPDRSTEQRAASIQQRIEAVIASQRRATAPAPAEPRTHAPKPIALTLRLDPARYARLSAHAARYTPRRSFQSIIVELIDAYLGDPGCGAMALDIMRCE
jgi:hypothetical protein